MGRSHQEAEPGASLEFGGRPSGAAAPGISILLVEDEAGIRGLVREVLSRDGHRVQEAGNLAEARAALDRDAALDLLVVDVSLPDGDGGAFALEAVAVRPALRAVVTSGCWPAAIPGEGAPVGRVRFLQKPYRSAQLKDAIAAARGAEAGT